MPQPTLQHRYSKLIALVMSAYMIFALGCFISDDSDEDDPDGPNNPSGPSTTLTGAINEAQTWRGRLNVTGNVTVRDGATITIEPGTIIELCANCTIEFGFGGGASTVKANGTQDEPIIFRGQTQTRGFWSSVIFGSNVTSDSVLAHTRFEHGGATGANAAVLLNGPVRLDNVHITESGASGIHASNFRQGSRGLAVDKLDGHPVVVTTDTALANYPADSALDRATLDAGQPTILITMPAITLSTTLRDQGIPYQMDNTITVRNDGTVLTLEAGVELIGKADRFLDVGFVGTAATLNVQGTAAKPVIMRGPVAEPGAWGGLNINPSVTTDSKISHLIVRDAGASTTPGRGYGVNVEATITFEDLTIENTQDRGIAIGPRGLRAGSKNLTVRDTRGYPMTLLTPSIFSHFTGDFTFEGNTNQRILYTSNLAITNSREGGTIVNPGIPYELGSDLVMGGDVVITIEPGTIFELASDRRVELGFGGGRNTIIARGTASAPIIFRGLNPTPGHWKDIVVRRSVVAASVFEHVHVLHGGGTEGSANLRLAAPVPISSSRFAHGSGFGLRIESEVNASYMLGAGNTFESNAKGEVDDLR